jgi:hypothetical protein
MKSSKEEQLSKPDLPKDLPNSMQEWLKNTLKLTEEVNIEYLNVFL